MRFILTITKDIIEKSLRCGMDNKEEIESKCAFALAYNELIPNVRVRLNDIIFENDHGNIIGTHYLTKQQINFINLFDACNEVERMRLIDKSFMIDIPDDIIEYWYSDAVSAVEKICNSTVLSPV